MTGEEKSESYSPNPFWERVFRDGIGQEHFGKFIDALFEFAKDPTNSVNDTLQGFLEHLDLFARTNELLPIDKRQAQAVVVMTGVLLNFAVDHILRMGIDNTFEKLDTDYSTFQVDLQQHINMILFQENQISGEIKSTEDPDDVYEKLRKNSTFVRLVQDPDGARSLQITTSGFWNGELSAQAVYYLNEKQLRELYKRSSSIYNDPNNKSVPHLDTPAETIILFLTDSKGYLQLAQSSTQGESISIVNGGVLHPNPIMREFDFQDTLQITFDNKNIPQASRHENGFYEEYFYTGYTVIGNPGFSELNLTKDDERAKGQFRKDGNYRSWQVEDKLYAHGVLIQHAAENNPTTSGRIYFSEITPSDDETPDTKNQMAQLFSDTNLIATSSTTRSAESIMYSYTRYDKNAQTDFKIGIVKKGDVLSIILNGKELNINSNNITATQLSLEQIQYNFSNDSHVFTVVISSELIEIVNVN